MRVTKGWWFLWGISVAISLTMLVLIVLFHNNPAEALSDAPFITSDLVKYVGVILIICMLIAICNHRNAENKKLITITAVILCVQVILHVLEFLCVRQSLIDMDRMIIERLLEEMKKQSLGAGS